MGMKSLEGMLGSAKTAWMHASTTAMIGTMSALYSIGCCPSPPSPLPYIDPDPPPVQYEVPITDGLDLNIPLPEEPVDPVPPDEPACVSPEINPAGAVDFYTAMTQANESAQLFSALLNGMSFDPAVADVNGPFDHDNDLCTPNGIPDIQEFYLISVVLNNPYLDLSSTGGVSFYVAAIAWNRNLGQMEYDLGEDAMDLVKGSGTIFTGFVMEGDEDSVFIPKRIMDLAVEHMSFLEVQVFDANNYTLLPQFFSASGDADGDGINNLDEYKKAVELVVPYPLLALDPCRP